MTARRTSRDFDVVLALSGGNALGAFQAGVYQALHDNGLAPDWIVGASIGAVNGALIAGSAPDQRIDNLRAFWRPDGFGLGQTGLPSIMETARRTLAVSWTLAAGRSGCFGPLLSTLAPWTDNQPSLFETNQLEATLDALVDFDALNHGPCRFTATAVDLTTGADVVMDSRDQAIDARHVRASTALPVAFPPVEVDGRWLVDGGLSANLPLDPILSAPPARPTLCIAVDLLPLGGGLPTTIGESVGRMQDLIFAAQSRRSIARWQADYANRDDASVALVRMAYAAQDHEVAGKALDFSGPTIAQRWKSGEIAGLRALARIADGSLVIGKAGLHVTDLNDDGDLAGTTGA